MTGAVTCKSGSDWIPPVDFVLEMYSSTSPASIWAGTTWTQLKNCIIFAAGSTFAAGSSGGSTSVSLNTNHLPSHGHSISTGNAGGHYHSTVIPAVMTGTSGADSQGEWAGSTTSYGDRAVTLSSTGGHNHTLYIGSTGSGQAFNITNPYYAVNIWQRVG